MVSDPMLAGRDCWIFDLDNTLYPSGNAFFDAVRRRMTEFIRDHLDLPHEAALALQRRYYLEHGTTLNGLMRHNQVDPEAYLEFVHDVDLSWLEPDPALNAVLAALPGRKTIYTNASTGHAEKVAERLGILDHFDEIFDIVAADYAPKPDSDAFDAMLARKAIDPRRAVFFEDIARNLEPAAARGVTTVLIVGGEGPNQPEDERHAHYVTEDLASWLEGVVAGRAPERRKAT